MAAALDGLLAEVAGLAAQLAAREEIARCLRDDYEELGGRVERLLQQRGRRVRRAPEEDAAQGHPAADAAAADGEERQDNGSSVEQEEDLMEPEDLSRLLPPEFAQQRAHLCRRRAEWQDQQRQAIGAAAAAQSEFVTQLAARDATSRSTAIGPRNAHAQRIAIARAYEHLRMLLSALPEPVPEPAAAAAVDPATTWAGTSDEDLVRLCIMVRTTCSFARSATARAVSFLHVASTLL